MTQDRELTEAFERLAWAVNDSRVTIEPEESEALSIIRARIEELTRERDEARQLHLSTAAEARSGRRIGRRNEAALTAERDALKQRLAKIRGRMSEAKFELEHPMMDGSNITRAREHVEISYRADGRRGDGPGGRVAGSSTAGGPMTLTTRDDEQETLL